MKRLLSVVFVAVVATNMCAQPGLKKVYDEKINPLEQIDRAVSKAKSEGKFVVCQVGGNWCPWCLRFADFIANDTTVSNVIADNYEYIHVNYNPRRPASEGAEQAAMLMNRLNNCGRFGFPVFVVLDGDGRVLHIQDSSFLESDVEVTAERPGAGARREWYNKEKVLRFFKNWTPAAVSR